MKRWPASEHSRKQLRDLLQRRSQLLDEASTLEGSGLDDCSEALAKVNERINGACDKMAYGVLHEDDRFLGAKNLLCIEPDVDWFPCVAPWTEYPYSDDPEWALDDDRGEGDDGYDTRLAVEGIAVTGWPRVTRRQKERLAALAAQAESVATYLRLLVANGGGT
jgi:hypothetical protein